MLIHEAKINYSIIQLGEETPVLNDPTKIVAYLRSGIDEYSAQETVWVISLNRKNFPVGRTLISIGTATSALAGAREIFRPAILQNATGIILAHSHPSGDPYPSDADVQLTRLMRAAGQTVDIPLVDHVIVGVVSADPQKRGYYSFREHGLI